MRRSFIILIFTLLYSLIFLSATAAKPVKDGALLHFDKSVFDFGTLSSQSDDVECCFEFSNEGTTPLVLLGVTTSCSCLKTDFSRRPVSVGGRAQLCIRIEMKKMELGVFHRVLQVRSNSREGVSLLTVQGVVVE